VGEAVDLGHHHRGRAFDGGAHVLAGGQQVPRLGVVDGHPAVLGQVAASAEGGAFGLEDDDLDLGRGVEAPDGGGQLAHHGQRHGVVLLGPGQDDPPDRRLPVDLHPSRCRHVTLRLVGHRRK
jgi:hypothetical protein